MEFLKILLESKSTTSADVNQVLKTLIEQQISGTISGLHQDEAEEAAFLIKQWNYEHGHAPLDQQEPYTR